ncbi:MAG: sigma-E factor negative regulatory protein [Burkholderiales bacterium]|nr:sigma-E factor negative regulatory protein [Burkholderiales bacterium]
MNENISRLMDGEVDDAEFERCVAALRSEDAMRTWTCYHVIGDHLRGAHGVSVRFTQRFKAALAAEPTVLAPPPARRRAAPATFAWAVAATLAAVTVVGWTAFSMVEGPPSGVAKAREAATVRAAAVRPPAGGLPSEYLLAHQEFSPAMAIHGAAPYLRAATATTEPQPRP